MSDRVLDGFSKVYSNYSRGRFSGALTWKPRQPQHPVVTHFVRRLRLGTQYRSLMHAIVKPTPPCKVYWCAFLPILRKSDALLGDRRANVPDLSWTIENAFIIHFQTQPLLIFCLLSILDPKQVFSLYFIGHQRSRHSLFYLLTCKSPNPSDNWQRLAQAKLF